MPDLPRPYLLFLGASKSPSQCKTAFGLRDWCREHVVGQYALKNCTVDLGLPWLSPAQAAAEGARSLVVGLAPVGGQIPDSWLPVFEDALRCGLDIVSGMHTRLSSVEALRKMAACLGRTLHDVRHADTAIPIANGRKRSGRRLLTVGTDCALGKKYTALAITHALRSRGIPATFRATGQTGIMIAGGGVAVDAIVADFLTGAAELLSPANQDGHWDVIEGQGALCHPAYAPVTLGLLHGSQPDALVLCHDPSRTHVESHPEYPIPDLGDLMTQYLMAARLTNRGARFVAISLNTSAAAPAVRSQLKAELSARFDLPVIDPILDGAQSVVTHLIALYAGKSASSA